MFAQKFANLNPAMTKVEDLESFNFKRIEVEVKDQTLSTLVTMVKHQIWKTRNKFIYENQSPPTLDKLVTSIDRAFKYRLNQMAEVTETISGATPQGALFRASSKDMVLTYADRVKRQGIWSFDLPKDYNREREVSVKFKTALNRQEIYEMLRKAKIPLSSLEGVVQLPGQQVELTFNSKNTAVKMAQALKNVPNVQSAIAQGDEFTNITVAWVPIDFPPQSIDQFIAKIGPFSKAKIGTDRLQQKKDGRRIYLPTSVPGEIPLNKPSML
ncbi:unnamed protein product [Clavelina lepadiformis]|uniref:Uncharacterized protein n=1 Tax=Clavelina lepadiformis TaxID=159417 RepID=A0ABP0FNF2_CLALP